MNLQLFSLTPNLDAVIPKPGEVQPDEDLPPKLPRTSPISVRLKSGYAQDDAALRRLAH
jgi:hypothetical protein